MDVGLQLGLYARCEISYENTYRPNKQLTMSKIRNTGISFLYLV